MIPTCKGEGHSLEELAGLSKCFDRAMWGKIHLAVTVIKTTSDGGGGNQEVEARDILETESPGRSLIRYFRA